MGSARCNSRLEVSLFRSGREISLIMFPLRSTTAASGAPRIFEGRAYDHCSTTVAEHIPESSVSNRCPGATFPWNMTRRRRMWVNLACEKGKMKTSDHLEEAGKNAGSTGLRGLERLRTMRPRWHADAVTVRSPEKNTGTERRSSLGQHSDRPTFSRFLLSFGFDGSRL
jgi:hypothetical protein